MFGPCTITASWLERYKDLYVAASDHKYFHLIKMGVVRREEFETWLMQHYLFTRMFARFVASLLNKTPKGPEFGEGHGDGIEMEMVLGSIMALDTEVKFLKGKAEEWELDWTTSTLKMHESNRSYCQLIHKLSQVDIPYSIGMMTLWSVASVFSLGWAMCAESPTTPCDLIEFCQRWGDDGLLDFCGFLQTLAEVPLSFSPPEVVNQAEQIFTELLKHQKSFMDIAIEIMEEMRTPEREREWQEKLVLEHRDQQLELEGRYHHHTHYVSPTDQQQEVGHTHSEDEDTMTSSDSSTKVQCTEDEAHYESESALEQLETELAAPGMSAEDSCCENQCTRIHDGEAHSDGEEAATSGSNRKGLDMADSHHPDHDGKRQEEDPCQSEDKEQAPSKFTAKDPHSSRYDTPDGQGGQSLQPARDEIKTGAHCASQVLSMPTPEDADRLEKGQTEDADRLEKGQQDDLLLPGEAN